MKKKKFVKHDDVKHDDEVVRKIQSIDCSRGIAHLHRADVLHRDIAARNCLLDNHGRVHVTDFGLSVLTHAAAVNGSWLHSEREWLPLKHMAPESMEAGTMLSSKKTETFMLGCLLWEIWTNQKCWSGIHAKVCVLKNVVLTYHQIFLYSRQSYIY